MRTALLVAALCLSASIASAEPPSTACGVQGQQTKVFGCLDLPVAHAVVPQSAIVFQGWTLSCQTGQQPSDVQVWYAEMAPGPDGQRRIKQLDASEFVVTWRTYRPDVLNYFRHYCNVSSPYLGYAIWIRDGHLPQGENVIAILFTDPAIGVGVVNQQVTITVVP